MECCHLVLRLTVVKFVERMQALVQIQGQYCTCPVVRIPIEVPYLGKFRAFGQGELRACALT